MAKEQKQDSPAPALGRNEKCHCGSGKKYKQCHLREDEAAARDARAKAAEEAAKTAEAEQARLAAEQRAQAAEAARRKAETELERQRETALARISDLESSQQALTVQT